jgi:hypothetical protein
VQGGNAGEYVYPGQPGWVLGQNQMATMHWGFPLPSRASPVSRSGPRP